MSVPIHCIVFIVIMSIRQCFYGPAAGGMEMTLFHNTHTVCCCFCYGGILLDVALVLLNAFDLKSLFTRFIPSLLCLSRGCSFLNHSYWGSLLQSPWRQNSVSRTILMSYLTLKQLLGYHPSISLQTQAGPCISRKESYCYFIVRINIFPQIK